MQLSDTRFLLALTAAAAPVAGHAIGQYWYGFLVFFVVIPVADVFLGRSVAPAPADEMRRLETSALFRFILYAWVPLQLGLILWGSKLISEGGLDALDAVLFTLSVGLATGATGITIAHELGHKRPALDRFLSRLLLVTVSYGHFTVEHNRGHHVRVATPEDPATARYGESFWRFLPRTLTGSFKDAFCMDPSEVFRMWAATFAVAATLGLAFGPLAVAFFLGQSAMAVL
ncbi:MAG: alkane 1-monooxygenase, partial [Burkholderiales bacterium]|nr:alkane 1-monooxygenase [Burkholderiales bacterium]